MIRWLLCKLAPRTFHQPVQKRLASGLVLWCPYCHSVVAIDSHMSADEIRARKVN